MKIAEFGKINEIIKGDENLRKDLTRKSEKISSKVELNDFFKKEIMPIVKKQDIDLTEEDLLNFAEDLLKFEEKSGEKISMENLSQVSGGSYLKPLLLSGGVLSTIVLGASIGALQANAMENIDRQPTSISLNQDGYDSDSESVSFSEEDTEKKPKMSKNEKKEEEKSMEEIKEDSKNQENKEVSMEEESKNLNEEIPKKETSPKTLSEVHKEKTGKEFFAYIQGKLDGTIKDNVDMNEVKWFNQMFNDTGIDEDDPNFNDFISYLLSTSDYNIVNKASAKDLKEDSKKQENKGIPMEEETTLLEVFAEKKGMDFIRYIKKNLNKGKKDVDLFNDYLSEMSEMYGIEDNDNYSCYEDVDKGILIEIIINCLNGFEDFKHNKFENEFNKIFRNNAISLDIKPGEHAKYVVKEYLLYLSKKDKDHLSEQAKDRTDESTSEPTDKEINDFSDRFFQLIKDRKVKIKRLKEKDFFKFADKILDFCEDQNVPEDIVNKAKITTLVEFFAVFVEKFEEAANGNIDETLKYMGDYLDEQYEKEANSKGPFQPILLDEFTGMVDGWLGSTGNTNNIKGVAANLTNLGASCFMDAAIQQLYNNGAFKKAIIESNSIAKPIATLRDLFIKMDKAKENGGEVTGGDMNTFVKDFGMVNTDNGTRLLYIVRQEDTNDCIGSILDQVKTFAPSLLKGCTFEPHFTVRNSNDEVIGEGVDTSGDDYFITVNVGENLGDLSNENGTFSTATLEDYTAENGSKYKNVNQIKNMTKFPENLIIRIKRYIHEQNEGGQWIQKKSTAYMKIPENLTIDGNNYRLKIVTVHSGATLNSGHYYNYLRNGDEWYRVDDIRGIWRVSFGDMQNDISTNATTVTYEKVQDSKMEEVKEGN